MLPDPVLERKAGMICANCYLHALILRGIDPEGLGLAGPANSTNMHLRVSYKAFVHLSLSRISAHNRRAASPILIEVTMPTRTVPDAETGDLRVATPPPKFIQFTIANTIARITMNHAPHNVLTVPMMKEMAEAIESLNGRADVKAILLQSAQQAFSAGISLEDSRPDRVFQTLDAFTRVFQAMVDISKPVIVVVNGPAIGAGSELVGFADVVIATPKAKFAQPEVKLGVFPPFAAVMLPQLIGTKKTYELILTGEALSAEDALHFGFVNKVVPESELETHVENLIARISEFSGPV